MITDERYLDRNLGAFAVEAYDLAVEGRASTQGVVGAREKLVFARKS